MSEPIPESIPTSADPRSHRPIKRARGSNTAVSAQANEIENLFLDPSRPVTLPPTSSSLSSKSASLPPPPEIVANVQGSSAGAGSGEFHVYKASRRREYERLRIMEEEAKKEDEDEEWAKAEEKRKLEDEERTRRNREKRMRKKEKKKGQAQGKEETVNGGGSGGDEVVMKSKLEKVANGVKNGLQISRRGQEEAEEEVDGMTSLGAEGKSSAGGEGPGVVIHDDD